MKLPLAIKILLGGILISSFTAGAAYIYTLYMTADAAVATVASSGKLTDILKAESLSGEEAGRVNILIAGNSADDPGHSGAELTDSILVASIDIATKKISLISIPRDLWVAYDNTESKINAVYLSGGMDGLRSVVREVTGLTINHAILVNYAALRDMIDTVGGIDIMIESGDPRGIYDPMIGFNVASGAQHLDGTQALLLARSRNDPTYDGRIAYGLPNGDFDRQMYQRKIAQALLEKIASSSSIVNPSTLAGLVEDMNGKITTDLSVGQMRRLYDLGAVSTLSLLSIRTDAGGGSLLADYTSYDGQSALVSARNMGDYSSIQMYIVAQL
ncbi:LCP family protein [Candidatus Saccharibacteria bacterium]|nr:LCP family protein [Candidatus Saccharibacteria bacterium]MBH2007946.1 LCP family protein [Candidatus Saccharibacteria bacterium]